VDEDSQTSQIWEGSCQQSERETEMGNKGKVKWSHKEGKRSRREKDGEDRGKAVNMCKTGISKEEDQNKWNDFKIGISKAFHKERLESPLRPRRQTHSTLGTERA
jgi:hypothetical protein